MRRRPASRPAHRAGSLGVEKLEDRTLLTLLTQSLFPADNPWNQNIAQAPVAANSATIMNSIISAYGNGRLHPDFGQDTRSSSQLYGIPYNVVHGKTAANVHVKIDAYASQSDVQDAPIPANAVLEGDNQNGPVVGLSKRGDSHLIVFDEDNNIAYEFYNASRPSENSDGQWHAAAEAVWNMNTDTFRTIGWTSADAAGLAILPGLVRPDEGLPTADGGQGVINHAIRFTLQNAVILNQFIYPASHTANPSNNSPGTEPPMGARFRLKASVDISTLDPESRIIAQAMKDYGMIVADNGSNFFFSGASYSVDANNQFALTWDDNDIQSSTHGLKSLTYSDFEVVDLTPVVTGLSATAGTTGTQITVDGENFSGAAGHLSVYFGTTLATSVTPVDDSHVLATAPAGSGTVDVTVQSGVSDPNDSSNIKSPIFGYGTSALSTTDQFTFASPLVVSASNWTAAGLTLTLAGDGKIHVYVTGTTTDVVTPRTPASVTIVQVTAPSTTTASLTIDSTSGNPIPAGGLSYTGGGGLIKIGSGSVNLTLANSFGGGGITVLAGTLVVTNSSAIPSGSNLSVGSNISQFFGAPAAVAVLSASAVADSSGGSSVAPVMAATKGSDASPAANSVARLPLVRQQVAAPIVTPRFAVELPWITREISAWWFDFSRRRAVSPQALDAALLRYGAAK